jgi:hypothetical protein
MKAACDFSCEPCSSPTPCDTIIDAGYFWRGDLSDWLALGKHPASYPTCQPPETLHVFLDTCCYVVLFSNSLRVVTKLLSASCDFHTQVVQNSITSHHKSCKIVWWLVCTVCMVHKWCIRSIPRLVGFAASGQAMYCAQCISKLLSARLVVLCCCVNCATSLGA